jgi:dTDP-D-glucose 4,6-dehydratase
MIYNNLKTDTNYIDISDENQLKKVFKTDLIIDCCAETSVEASKKNSNKVFNTNLIGTLNILNKCRKDKSGIIFLSSSRVYSLSALNKIITKKYLNKEIAIRKTIDINFDTLDVKTIYGYTKFASEQLIKEYSYLNKIKYIINRCGVISGPWQFGKIDQGTTFTFTSNATGLNATKENYKVVGIIWTKVGNTYRFFNANIVNVEGISSSKDFTKAEKDFDVFQSESGNIVLHFKNEKFSNNSIIQVTDITGKVISTSGIDGQNTQTISGLFLPGMHIVSIKEDNHIVSKKIVLQ